jgi:hypothetical protein
MSDWRLTLFSNKGIPLADVKTHVECEWVLNDYGELTFTISKEDPACKPQILRKGNFVFFQHSKAGTWGGVIRAPRAWTRKAIKITAHSGAVQFARRVGPSEVWTGTPGVLFQKAIDYGNAQGNMRIRRGDIWTGGDDVEDELRHDSLIDYIKNLQDIADCDWQVRAVLDDKNRIQFYADFKKIENVVPLVLREGPNSNLKITDEDEVLLEQDDIVNEVLYFGSDGEQFRTRKKSSLRNEESIKRYGLEQMADALPERTASWRRLLLAAYKRLNRMSREQATYHLTALNVGRTFELAREGNIGKVYLPGFGFRSESSISLDGGRTVFGNGAKVRVLGRVLSTAEDTMELALEVK